jgi:hypothetical protein
MMLKDSDFPKNTSVIHDHFGKMQHTSKISQAYNMVHGNINKFELKERTFEGMPPKRHSSYEDRLKSDSVQKRCDPRLYVTQRNCNSTQKHAHEKQHNNEYSIGPINGEQMLPENIGRINSSAMKDDMQRTSTGIGGNRHLQPRQNPLIGHSPRVVHKIHLTPYDKKRKFNDTSYGKRGMDMNKIKMVREAQNQKAKRNRSSELISGYYKINRSKLAKNQYGIK